MAVNHILKDLHQLIRVHPSVRDNDFIFEPLPEDISAKINGTDLIQIMMNLAINGFQCMKEKHSVEIKGRYLPQPLDLARFADGENDRFVNGEGFKNTGPLLALSVKDTGPGIPAEILPKIFDPYFTTKTLSGGTGLGLNVVHRLVKETRASLHVHTEPGCGTTFTVYFPVG